MKKLEMIGTIRRAYRAAFTPALFSRGVIFWAVALAVYLVVSRWVVIQLAVSKISPYPSHPKFAVLQIIWSLICILFVFIIYSGIAVSVHRFVLLGESARPLRFGKHERRYYWRFLAVYFRFLLWVIAVSIGGVLIVIIVGMLFPAAAPISMYVAVGAVFLGLFVYLSPYVLVLPGLAVGEAGLSFAEASAIGRHSRWRMFVVMAGAAIPMVLAFALVVVCVVIFSGGQSLLLRIAALNANFLLATMIGLIALPIHLLMIVLQAACMSYIYRDLVQRAEVIPPPADPAIL